MDRNGNGAALAAKSRADQFEDEKRRIIESCFNKTDPDGSCSSPFSSIPLFEDVETERPIMAKMPD
jgi:hypothetical protein